MSEYYKEMIKELRRERDKLVEALEKIRKESVPSSVSPNYDVCQFGRIEEIASEALLPYQEKETPAEAKKKEPERILEEYRAEVRRLYGSEIAEKSQIDYDRGWYYIELARKFPGGSIGIISNIEGTPAYRKKQVLQMIEEFKKRVPATETKEN